MHLPALILLRGLPGSGKSSLADILSEKGTYPVFSVDQYFTNSQGEYSFRFEENHIAYAHCRKQTEESMKKSLQKIFVDNTFTMQWEIEPYFQLAAAYSYSVFVVTVENYGSYKNVHHVTDDQLRRMAEKYAIRLL
jgi:predicted kinase